ncbi:MAG: serine/threonine-protein kinase [Planctomyces sp.]
MSDRISEDGDRSRQRPDQKSDDERELLLAELLSELLEIPDRSDSVQRLEEMVRLYPQLARDLRELWATSQIADAFGIESSSGRGRILAAEAARLSNSGMSSGISDSGSAIGIQIGDYELQEEIGRGGMGVVYRAWQQSLRRTVALKMIPNAAFAASTDLARLRAEALSAARLSHPSIVPVYEVGEHNGQPWFSMQFIEGKTLSQVLIDGPMQPRDAVSLLVPVVEAIGTAHRSGVLHRDLKPSNILIARDGTPFVTDFGLAKQMAVRDNPEGGAAGLHRKNPDREVSGLTLSGAILGTPAWMSPEQAAGLTDSIDVATDVYSLGAVLFAMLTGRPPFQAASPLDTVLMVMEQDPPGIRVLNSAVDSDLEMVVMKCLQKPQDLRYSSAHALAADLKAWLMNEPVSARSSTVVQVVTRLFRESHHAAILQNWGLLWMWHSLVLLILCLVTNVFQLQGVSERWPYVTLWVVGLGLWAITFWNVRHRSGPITAIERQIAHVWAGSMIASSLLFGVEWIMHLPVLELSPVLGAIAGIVFLVKAGMLSGRFYLQAVSLFSTSLVMAAIQNSQLPNFSIALFGIVSALTFFVPGLKYYRLQKKRRILSGR